MLFFLPPVVQVLAGAAVLAGGAATHLVILEVLGCLSIVVGGYRWLRKRGGGAGR